MAESRVYKEGPLEKRQRGLEHTTDKLKFQLRYFVLTTESLIYYKDGKHRGSQARTRGTFPVDRIKIIEAMDESVFKKEFCFQIGDKEEVLYLVSSSLDERTDWIKEFEQAAASNNNEMLPSHHWREYSRKLSQWLCCGKAKSDTGCTNSPTLNESGVVRRTTVKDERSSKRRNKETDSKRDYDSGYISERANSLDEVESHAGKKVPWGNMMCLRSFVPTVSHRIVAVKFMTKDCLVLALDNCSVHIYDIPSNAIVHNIKLVHPISSIGVWNGYLLIGSSVVHVVDTSSHSSQWKRTVVVDMQEQDSVQNPSQHLAVFNSSTGEFATASRGRNMITFWPQPQKETGGLMTDSIRTLKCRGNVSTLRSESNVLFVLHNDQQHWLVDKFQWSSTERHKLKTISLTGTVDTNNLSISQDGEYVYLATNGEGAQDLSVKTMDVSLMASSGEEEITCLADTCLHDDDHYLLITGSSSGKVKIWDTHSQQAIGCLLPPHENSSAATSVAYSGEGNLIAVGTDSGTLAIWGETETVLGQKKTALELLEITKFSIYMPASFSRHSIITGAFSFEADSRGGLFVNRPSYSLEIPRGAIREGESVHIQTGIITCLGSDRFKFPEKYQVVSPVVWFCGDQKEDFLEPLTVELQHCVQLGQHLTVLKAKCSVASDVFEFLSDGEGTLQDEYGTFQTTHFCLYCLSVVDNQTPRRVCVVPVEGAHTEQRKGVTFCVCYNLDTCLHAIDDQYRNKCHNHRCSPIELSLQAGDDRISFTCTSPYAALTSGRNEVLVSDLNFINRTQQDLASAHKQQTYPPRVCYNISGTGEEKVVFTFGAIDRKKDTYEVVYKQIAAPSGEETSDTGSSQGSPHMHEYPFRQPDYHSFPANHE